MAGRRGHKFNARPMYDDGYRFDSKLEGTHYRRLKQFVKEGSAVFFLRQVPLHLAPKSTLRVDFVVFWADGTVSFIDSKGMPTQAYKTKKAIAEHIYPIEIEEWTK